MYKFISLAIAVVLLGVWLGFSNGEKAKTEENMPKAKLSSGSHPLNTLSDVVVSTEDLSQQEKNIMLEQVISTDKLFPDPQHSGVTADGGGKTYVNEKEKPLTEANSEKTKPHKEKKEKKPAKKEKRMKNDTAQKEKPAKPEKPAKEEEKPVKVTEPAEKPEDQKKKPESKPKPEKPQKPAEEDSDTDDGIGDGQSDTEPQQQEDSAQIQSLTQENGSTTE
ncbi:hypothetical protein [Fictibacillus terranigra]|uniref:YqxM protein n=1 Tax=Fictibacillus terranigra TaxID=3058424 RepID=A0ABT8E8Q8_9BACL|nr:hypothetical protein [Fictibacillus sp. CENA-BCM004]MDN4074279.1 hypothetical protein [Fictibacillus sp. CENA-BCM004]